MDEVEELRTRLEESEGRLNELRSKLPAHSLRPHQMQEVEDAEDEVRELRERLAELEGR